MDFEIQSRRTNDDFQKPIFSEMLEFSKWCIFTRDPRDWNIKLIKYFKVLYILYTYIVIENVINVFFFYYS